MTLQSPRLLIVTAGIGLAASAAQADQVILDDLIVDGSACVGFDCVNGESFGFDTIRLKENNLRIKFDDTSSAASFPDNDWQITINASANGGANKFSIDDISNSRTPFTIEALAPSNSLYVDDGGRIGSGTSTPSTDVHVIDGDSPTLRLQQDGSSGFAPQTWDMAGNETNFFVRDVSNGSQLPFRIRPAAPTNSIFIDSDGDVGLGTASPDAPFEVSDGGDFVFFRLTSTGAGGPTNDSVDITYTSGAANTGEMRYNIVDGDGFEMSLNADGDMTITGTLTSGGPTCAGGCDAVFDEDYALMSIEDYAASMYANRHLPHVGPTLPGQPINVTEKMGNMLNALEHAHIYIAQQHIMIKDLKATHAEELAALKDRLNALEAQ